jgi:hypothetical protein
MSKPFTDVEFSSQISSDLTWRIKEISDLKTAASRADRGLQQVLLRATVAICYSHWEGHVRFAARKYFEHIALRKHHFNQLDKQFLKNYFLPRLAAISNARSSIAERCNLVDKILTSSDERYARVNDDLVNTKANLNYDVLTDICLVCSVPIISFETHKAFIDVFLLKRRNEIAHGENTFVAVEDLDELSQKTVELMRTFGNQLENHVVLKTYKRA